MNAVDIQGLTKRYSDMTAVDALSLTIGEGELFALLASTVRANPLRSKCCRG